MRRCLIVTALFCLCGLSAWADDNESSRATLQRVSERLTVADVTRGAFTQEHHLNVLSRPLVSRGDFVYHRQLGVRWSVIEPFASTMVVAPTGVFYQGEQAQPFAKGFGQLLLTLMQLDVEQLARNFVASGDPGGDEWKLVLKPRHDQWRQAITEIQLRGNQAINQVGVLEASGDKVLVTFTDIRYQPPLSDEERRELVGE